MKNIDIEARLFILLLHLKEEKLKIYTGADCEENSVYIFDNYSEFKLYFLNSGINIDDTILEICKMKETKKGTIIALKKLCDYAIQKYKEKESLSKLQDDKTYIKSMH